MILGMHLSHIGLLLRYGIAGVFGACIQTSALYVWVSVLGFESTYLLGAVIGFALALIITFLLQKYWTFRDHTTYRTRRQFTCYSIVAVCNVALNLLLLMGAKALLTVFGIDFFHGWYLAAQIFAVTIASGMSFVVNYFFTFKREPTASPEQ